MKTLLTGLLILGSTSIFAAKSMTSDDLSIYKCHRADDKVYLELEFKAPNIKVATAMATLEFNRESNVSLFEDKTKCEAAK